MTKDTITYIVFIVAIVIILAILTIYANDVVMGNYNAYGMQKNVTVEMSTGDYWTCYMGEKVEECNVIDIDKSKFRLLNSMNEFLAFGPDLKDSDD